MNSLGFLALGALFVLSASAANSQVIFNDNFNGSDILVNDGAGSVNPTSSTTAFVTDSNSGQNSGGAYFTPGSQYQHQNLDSITGNTDNGFGYSLASTGTNFTITVNNINVTQDSAGNRGDIPNSNHGGFRYELGLVSDANTNSNAELYTNGSGGLYVSLFYDKEGNITGNLRAEDTTKSGNADSAGSTGIFELASFTLPSNTTATTSSYTNPLMINFDLTGSTYAVSFSQTATVSSGSLSGTFTPLEQTDLSNGVRASLFTQGWDNGDGTGNIREFEVSAAPEPPIVYLLGLGLAAFAFVGFRRTVRIS